ncbi:MAG: thioredoxin domain-containing protein, partial [Gemmatimonadetes bacterium]|nr:thioredoxin domain-containing protein [Gemmatimonadota bacterium]
LYDNAQLARVYVEAYQVTGTERWASIARETLDYVLREMTDPDGGFRSATDADSEGREGTYFVWRVGEVDSLLGDDAPLFRRAYGMRERGDFVDAHHPDDLGMNVLHVAASTAELAREFGRSEAEIAATLDRSRETLLRERDTRAYPGLDDKVLTAWNGLMIGAFAYAGRVLGEPRYVEAAVRAADFVERELRADDGRLLRTWRDGSSHIDAFLEDYAFLAGAELDLWEATFDPRWFRAAADLTRRMNERFEDAEHGGWFHTTGEEASLPARSKSPWDHSQPSATSEAALVNLRLAALTGDRTARDRVERALAAFSPALRRAPGGTLGWLDVLERLRSPGVEVVVVGPPETPATVELLRIAQGTYLPGSVLAYRTPAADPKLEVEIPLLRDKREVGGQPAGYVCRNFACLAPVTSGEDLVAALAAP